MMRGRFVVAVVGLVLAVAACSSGSSASSSAKRQPDLVVLMDPHATAAETAAVRRAIRESDDVERYSFTSHVDAYREFRKVEKDSDLAAVTRPSDLPESFRVALGDGVRRRAQAARLDRMPGVQSVVVPPVSPKGLCPTKARDWPTWMQQQCNDTMDSY